MRLGIIKTIVREELSKFEKLPGWMDPFLQTLNTFMANVGQAVNGNLDFKNNFFCVVKTLEITHAKVQEINPEKPKNKVIGVACFNANGAVIDKFGWKTRSNGNIDVTIYFDGATKATCEIIIFLG